MNRARRVWTTGPGGEKKQWGKVCVESQLACTLGLITLLDWPMCLVVQELETACDHGELDWDQLVTNDIQVP